MEELNPFCWLLCDGDWSKKSEVPQPGETEASEAFHNQGGLRADWPFNYPWTNHCHAPYLFTATSEIITHIHKFLLLQLLNFKNLVAIKYFSAVYFKSLNLLPPFKSSLRQRAKFTPPAVLVVHHLSKRKGLWCKCKFKTEFIFPIKKQWSDIAVHARRKKMQLQFFSSKKIVANAVYGSYPLGVLRQLWIARDNLLAARGTCLFING